MPSPFPGMDPYLEKPSRWPDFHHSFISISRELLTRQVRPRFFVAIEERVYISDEGDPGRQAIVPDISIIELPEHDVRVVPTEDGGTVEVAEPIIMQTMMDYEVREARLEILDAQSGSIVTVIEVVSPANKVEGARGRSSYLEKRVDIMNSPCHLVEIDLLTYGKSFFADAASEKSDYFVHISRAGQERPNGKIWPIRLHQRLPEIPIPLKADIADVSLDLQAVLNTAYDRAGYDLVIDYHRDPVPVLSPEQAEWVDVLLKRKRLR